MKSKVNPRVIVIVFFLILVNISVQSAGATVWYGTVEMQLTLDINGDRYPAVFRASDRRIWFVWHADRISGDTEIFYKVYNPNQTNPWSPDTRLTFSPGLDIAPTIMQALDGRIWIAWVSKRSGNYTVYYKTYNGTWSDDTQIPILLEQFKPQYPSILQAANGTILIFWGSQRGGLEREIYYKASYDNGVSWTNDTLFTPASSTADDWDPAATLTSTGNIWLVWTRVSGNDENIYYTFHDGISWRPASAVYASSNLDWHPSITQAADGKMWVVWDSGPAPVGSPGDIYYNVWDGTRFLGATPLVTDASGWDDNMPSITRAYDGTLWVVWCSDRPDHNFDLYYKLSSSSPLHDIGIFNVSPRNTIVSQGRSVTVDIVAQNLGTSSETFDITMYANTTFVGSRNGISLTPGQLYPTTIDWSTSGFPLGKYTLTVNATVVAGDANPADNTYVDGNVTVVTRDVLVITVTPVSTQLYKGYTTQGNFVYVVVKNNGTIRENVSVSLYGNTTRISTQTAYNLDPGENSTLTFVFYTTSVPYGNYHIVAKATPVPNETDYFNNNLEDGMVKVTIPGDVNGDRKVDVYDLALISAHWSDVPEGPLGYDATVEINGDWWIDLAEVRILSLNWGVSW